MNRSKWRLAALLLPLIGLLGTWIWTHARAQQGTEWQVPVQGYDPRDLLRGHYITYRYDWPGLSAEFDADYAPILCLEGKAPVLAAVHAAHPQFGLDGPPPPAEGCRQFVRAQADVSGLGGGILYVPQDKAAGLDAKLRDPALQGMITIRVRGDGHITPLHITFRARPLAADPR